MESRLPRPIPGPNGMVPTGRSADGRCTAALNLNARTVETVKRAPEATYSGVWQITDLQQDGEVRVTVYLPSVRIMSAAEPGTRFRPANLTLTFRGAGVREVLDQAAEAWCRTVPLPETAQPTFLSVLQ